MNTQRMLIVGLAVAIGIAVASMMIAARKARPVSAGHPALTTHPVVDGPAPAAVAPVIATNPATPAPKATTPPKAPLPKISTLTAQPPEASPPLTINGYAVQDPSARAALSFVGADPDATQYWLAAISDPALPTEERRDLIEDLNEDGLSDPKNPRVQDVPLIVNRIRIIEQLAPYQTDPATLDALAEAYKDLNNMLAGQPVR